MTMIARLFQLKLGLPILAACFILISFLTYMHLPKIDSFIHENSAIFCRVDEVPVAATCDASPLSDDWSAPPEAIIDPPMKLSGIPSQKLPWIATSENECKRTILLQSDRSCGFGSMLFLMVLPGIDVGAHHGYTPVIDDRDWNYGRMSDYFHPMAIPCTPPADYLTRPRLEWGEPGWEEEDHIVIHRHGGFTEVNVDKWWRHTYLRGAMRQDVLEVDKVLTMHKERTHLPSDLTFTPSIRPAYRAITEILGQVWRLNDFMLQEVEHLVAKTRPARQSGRPVLGVIARLGDKAIEQWNNPGPSAYGNYQGFLSMAQEQLGLLMGDQPKMEEKPMLFVMSDDIVMAMEGFTALPDSELFEMHPLASAVEEVDLPEDDDRSYENPDHLEHVALSGHEQGQFNSQPLVARIALGRTLVRDMEYMARHIDAVSASSSSNIGRMVLMLAGERRAFGYDGATEKDMYKSIGGLARSLDTRWFPCVYYSGCFA